MVLFGVTGDLSRKKVMPAIYDLANRGLLPPGLQPGRLRPPRLGRPGLRADRARLGQGSTPAPSSARRSGTSSPRASGSCPGNFDDDVAFDQLRRTIEELDEVRGTGGNHAFYLAIPPGFFGDVVGQLKEHGLAEPERRTPGGGWWSRSRSATTSQSARELQPTLSTASSRPESIFRIDHYLGKETVQNILAMRFANEMFEPIWNSNYVDHVQITMAEDIGIGGRAGYYDGIGAARDVIQNHLLQLMALVAMEEPISFDAESLRIEKQKVLTERRPAPAARPDHRPRPVRRGLGRRREGRRASSRRRASSARSTTETFAAVTLHVDTRRWAGVPFYLRTGKRLGRRVTEVAVVFKRAPHLPFTAQRHRGADPERPGDPGPARRGHDDAVRLQGARHRDGDPRRQHGLRLRRLVHRGQPGGLRAADPRRAARRPAAVPAPRGGRAVLEDPRPDPRALGAARGSRPEQYPSGTWGPESADAMLAPRRPASGGGPDDRAHRHQLLARSPRRSSAPASRPAARPWAW